VNIDPAAGRTGLIISSTKGNINLLESEEITDGLKERMTLHSSAKLVAEHFKFPVKPVIVSHACVSGLLGIITGMRLLQQGLYDHIVVTGADIITKFVLSGFQSFQAISDEPCKPFDANRKGITLGEGAATVILSASQKGAIKVCSGAVSNDANHISGPSRTGKELFQAISQAMKDAGVEVKNIDMISAHGTATLYNDDMESRAINLAGLQQVPVNSLKGYYGHTLGAAGLIETVISIHSMKANTMIPTKGFTVPGTAESINVCSTLQPGLLNTCLKTASGFGGCNAAVVFQKTAG
jgi:3-oxoacyl-[acyl-carrier-protein] synthase-1